MARLPVMIGRMTMPCHPVIRYMSSASAQAEHKQSFEKLKQWQIGSFTNDLSSLKLAEDLPGPFMSFPDQVVVRVNAASVNPIDVAIARGYGQNLFRLARVKDVFINGPEKLTYDKFPMTLGRDFSGVVVHKGSSVENVTLGDEVWGIVPPQNNQGSHGNYVILKERYLSHKPSNMDHIQAASIPYAGLTAHSALTCFGGLNERNSLNRRVLVLGGTGGVGLMAIQLLKAWGAYVTATCAGDAKEWLMANTSVNHVIDYKTKELEEKHKNSYDLVLNAASGDNTIMEDGLKCLKKWKGSRYITLNSPLLRNYDANGYIRGTAKTLTDLSCNSIKGFKEGTQIRWAYFIPSSAALDQIKGLAEDGKIRAVVEQVFDFHDVPLAYQKVISGHARGKTLIKID